MEQRVQGAVALRMRQDMGQGLFLALSCAVILVAVMLGLFPGLRDIFVSTTQGQRFWDKAAHDPRMYVYPLTALALIVYAWLRRNFERLIVGPDGLRYVSFLGGPFAALQPLHPGWRLSWSEVDKVELQVQALGLGKRAYWLVVDPEGAKKRIDRPLGWEQVPEIPHSRADRISSRDEQAMRKAILASPLVRALRQFGVQVVDRPGLTRREGAIKGYDIGQDKRLMIAVGLLLVALVYYFGDTFIDWPYMAVDNVPMWPYALVGAVGLWLGYDLGRNAPRMERILISVMLAGSLCAASYPLMLRFNALSAPAGSDLYTYTQVKPGYFKPPKAGLPWIYFDNQPAYWVGLPGNGTHQFRIVKGALGFYEVDTGRVQDDIKAWWASQAPKNQ